MSLVKRNGMVMHRKRYMYNKEVPNPMSMDFRAVEKASTIFRGMKFEVL